MTELYTQILEIEALLKKAQSDSTIITWKEHHPDYPKSVYDLMSFIARSEWIYSEYRKHRLVDVLENIDSANLEKIQCAITTISRMEKWCTGSWIEVLKERQLDVLVQHALKLVKLPP